MKPTIKDYLSIALALLAIFLCGYGIGFLLGERKGLQTAPSPASASAPAPTKSLPDWEERTLETLQKTIELTPAQLEKVKAEIAASSSRIHAARETALGAYRAELTALHARLQPLLTPEQWERLQQAPQQEGSSK
jgi:hypothetical protein